LRIGRDGRMRYDAVFLDIDGTLLWVDLEEAITYQQFCESL
jgi:hypothetical protein